MKKIILLIVILLVITFAYADPSFIYKQSTQQSIRVSCFDSNNTPCASSSICKLTVIKPDTNVLLNNVSMTNAQTFHNYSINTTQTIDLGEYSAIVYCNGTSANGFSTFNYLVTRSGKVLDTSESIIYLILTSVIFLILIASIYFASITPFKNVKDSEGYVTSITKGKYMKLLLISISYGLFLWFLNLLIGISDSFTNLSIYYGFTSFVFNILLKLTYPLIFIIFLIGVYEAIKDSKIKEILEKMGKA